MTKTRARRPAAGGRAAPASKIGPYLKRVVQWKQTGDPLQPYSATVGAQAWRIRVNDFPDDRLYTLWINERNAGSFDDWPASWTRPQMDPIIFQLRESDVLSRSLEQVTTDLRRELIRAALDRVQGDARKVAKHLRIRRNAVDRVLRDYGKVS